MITVRRRLMFTVSPEQGLTYGEIAELFGISPKTVEMQMGRTYRALRTLGRRGLHTLEENMTMPHRDPRARGALRLAAALAMGAGAGISLSEADAQQVARADTGKDARAQALVFDRVNVVDVETGEIRSAQRVVVVGNKIKAVGHAGKISAPAGARIVDARGKYLIPGLWDMHVHNIGDNNPYMPFVLTGVTGVRDMGTSLPLDTLHRWRREILAGERVGPRIIMSGLYLEADTSWIGWPWQLAAAVRTVDDAKRVVDSMKAAGADFIKVHYAMESVTREVFFAIAAAARRAGIPLAGHQPTPSVSMAEAADSGQRSFEHVHLYRSPCFRTDSVGTRECRAEAARLVQKGAWLSPTLCSMAKSDSLRASRRPDWFLDYQSDTALTASGGDNLEKEGLWFVNRMHSLGVGFLAASDLMVGRETPTNLMENVHGDLQCFVDARFTPLEALQTATLNPARYFETTDTLGTIAPKKLADLVLLEANPLADISNTTKISAVVANGRYFDRAELDSLTAAYQANRASGTGHP